MFGDILASNYFDIFDLEPSFDVDQSLLRKKYFKLSRQFQPDLNMHLSSAEQEEMLTKTGEINNALKVLQDPQSIVKHLLEENGYLEPDQKEQLSPDFLMEMMDLNEMLMDLEGAYDQQGYKAAKDQMAEHLDEVDQKLVQLKSLNPKELSKGQWEEIKENYFKSRYLLRIQEKMNTLALPNEKTT